LLKKINENYKIKKKQNNKTKLDKTKTDGTNKWVNKGSNFTNEKFKPISSKS
jgi:hypothetical protein